MDCNTMFVRLIFETQPYSFLEEVRITYNFLQID